MYMGGKKNQKTKEDFSKAANIAFNVTRDIFDKNKKGINPINALFEVKERLDELNHKKPKK